MKRFNIILSFGFILLSVSSNLLSGNYPYAWGTIAGQGQNKLESDFWYSGPPSNRNFYLINNLKDTYTFYHYWVTAHAMETQMDAFERTGDVQYKTRVRVILDRIKLKEGNKYTTHFYDDMAWMGIACIRAYQLFNDGEYMVAARQLMADTKNGWVEPNGTEPGGMLWNKNPEESSIRNSCTHWTVACFAARLYLQEGDASNLQFAQKVYDWSMQYLYNSTQKAVISKSHPDVSNAYVTYNQGVFIGSSLALYQITKTQDYLDKAIACADFCVDPAKTQMKENGIWRDEGKKDDLNSNNGIFKGILVHYFVDLIKSADLPVVKRSNYVQYLEIMGISLYNNTKHNFLFPGAWDRASYDNEKIYLGCQLSGIILLESMDFVLRNYPDLLGSTSGKWTSTGNYSIEWYSEVAKITKDVTLTSAAQFAGVSYLSRDASPTEQFEGWTVRLGSDIDLSAHYWMPIGGTDATKGFSGNFDGGGHTISGLQVSDGQTGTSNNALFGFVAGDNSKISNLFIGSGNIISTKNATAAVVAQTNNNIIFEKVGVSADVIVSGQNLHQGVILGSLNTNGKTITMNDCFSMATLNFTGTGAGLAGKGGFIGSAGSHTAPESATVIMQHCYFGGEIYTNSLGGNTDYVGALIGFSSNRQMTSPSNALADDSKKLYYTSNKVNTAGTGELWMKAIGKKHEPENYGTDEIAIPVSKEDLKSAEILLSLNDGRNNTWEIRAGVNNGYPAPFGPTSSVQTPDENSFRISTEYGAIRITGMEKESMVRIFDLHGRLNKSVIASDNTIHISLPSGLYLIRINEKTAKTIVL